MSNPRTGPRYREYWHPTNVIFIRRTIYGSWIRGNCYKRYVSNTGGNWLEEPIWQKEYITAKELFIYKLKVGAQ